MALDYSLEHKLIVLDGNSKTIRWKCTSSSDIECVLNFEWQHFSKIELTDILIKLTTLNFVYKTNI